MRPAPLTALVVGADAALEGLPAPATAAALRATIHAARRLRAQRDAVSATDVTVTALLEIVDLGIPGAAERAERITDLVRHVAARCGVPARLMRDLEIAAR